MALLWKNCKKYASKIINNIKVFIWKNSKKLESIVNVNLMDIALNVFLQCDPLTKCTVHLSAKGCFVKTIFMLKKCKNCDSQNIVNGNLIKTV